MSNQGVDAEAYTAFFIGTESILDACLHVWLDRGLKVDCVMTDSVSTSAWCDQADIACFPINTDLREIVRRKRPDYLFSVGNYRIIPAELLEFAINRSVNYHNGPLPKYAGRNAPSWAIMNGESEYAVTWHEIEPTVDTGQIAATRSFPIHANDTAYSLNMKCFEFGIETFTELTGNIISGDSCLHTQQDQHERRFFSSFDRPPAAGILNRIIDPQAANQLTRSLSFKPIDNPLCCPKLWSPQGMVLVDRAVPETDPQNPKPLSNETELRILSNAGAFVCSGFTDLEGTEMSANIAVDTLGWTSGCVLLDDEQIESIDAIYVRLAKHETAWAEILTAIVPLEIGSSAVSTGTPTETRYEFSLSDHLCMPSQNHDLVWLALWLAFLARYSGQHAFATPLAADPNAKYTKFPSLFETTPPLPSQIDLELPFGEHLAQIAEHLHRHQTRETYILDLPHRSNASLNGYNPIAFDLTGSAEVRNHSAMLQVAGKQARLVSAPNANAQTLCDRLGPYFVEFIRNTRSDRPLNQIGLISGEVESTLVDEWNQTSRPFPPSRLVDRILGNAATKGDAIAVSDANLSLTYDELRVRVRELQAGLQSAGVGAGQLVGVYCDRSCATVTLLLALLRCRAAYLPLDPRFPPDRVRFMIADSKAGLIVCSPTLKDELNDVSVPVVSIDQLDNVSVRVREAPRTDITDLAYVLYTSGSTGKPKGVMVPESCLSNFIASMLDKPGIVEDDICLAVTTISFDISALEIYGTLAAGARVILASHSDAADPTRLAKLLEDESVSIMQATPSTWRMLLTNGWQGKPDLKVLCGGEPFPSDLKDRLLSGCGEVWNMYGPTETTVWSTCAKLESDDAVISIGTPIANTQTYVLDQYMTLCPIGVAGELFIGGRGVARGYLDQENLTGDRFRRSPFDCRDGLIYATGDLVRWLDDGTLQHLGRMDEQVKIRGYRVELGEVELTLERQPGIRQAIVNIWKSGSQDHRLVAYLKFEPAAELGVNQIRRELAKSLPDYMLPHHYVTVERFRLTANGKIDRLVLPAPQVDSLADANSEEPVDESERLIEQIWGSAIGVNRVSRTARFFEIGGHSLLAISVCKRMQDELELSVGINELINMDLSGVAARTKTADQSPTFVTKVWRRLIGETTTL